MSSNWILAVCLHWAGGLASASFYVPYRKVKRWSWETYWLVGGIFSWLIAPVTFASILIPGFWPAISDTSGKTLFWTYFFGVLWGLGGLTFGLTMRFLGVGLGMAIALSYCAAFGTLVPPVFMGTFGNLVHNEWGIVTLSGVLVCLMGIGVSGIAGMSKEKELTGAAKTATVREFNFPLGFAVATFSGIMSACFNFALTAGNSISVRTSAILLKDHGSAIWKGLPELIIVLLGGFTTNFIWCVILHFKNRTGAEYILPKAEPEELGVITGIDGPGYAAPANEINRPARNTGGSPLPLNYLFCALAGTLWYLQFFFYTMGQTKMPAALKFSGWTLHMASIIIFATLWGVFLHEWKGTSKRTHAWITLGLIMLVGSTIIVGWGNHIKSKLPKTSTTKKAAMAGPSRAPQPASLGLSARPAAAGLQ